MKQGPFSLYDFLGYFFPGAISIFAWSICLSEIGVGSPSLDPRSISKWTDLLPFVLAAYVMGHVVSLLSSATIERYFIWSFSYPSKTLLRYRSDDFLRDSATFSLQNVMRVLVSLLLLPISSVATVVCIFMSGKPGFVAQLDPLLARMIRRKISALIVEQGQISRPNDYIGPREGDFFRLAYHYVLENAAAHNVKMQNYVALFGFNRSLCLLFVSLFWFSTFAHLFGGGSASSAQILATCFLLANIFFFGFAKFYRRFSLEALMALAAVFKIPEEMKQLKIPRRPAARVGVGHDIRTQPSKFNALMRGVRARIRHHKQA